MRLLHAAPAAADSLAPPPAPTDSVTSEPAPTDSVTTEPVAPDSTALPPPIEHLALPIPAGSDSLTSPAAHDSVGAAALADTFVTPTPLFAPPPVAPAPEVQAPAPTRFGTITVEGNRAIESTRILRSFEVPPGSAFSNEAVRRGMNKLFALGLFDDLWIDRLPRGEEMDLVIHVVERPRIRTIEFHGNKHKDNDDLAKKLILHTGEPYSAVQVQSQVDSLLKYYRDDGYAQVAIDAVTDTTGGTVGLTFNVKEGEKVKITAIIVEGAHSIDQGKLRKAIKTKKKKLIGGGKVDQEQLDEDQGRLEAYYHNHGFRDAHVTGHELRPGDSPKHLTLVIHVDEGRRYYVGKVTWAGNTRIRSDILEQNWWPRPEELYDRSRIEKAQGDAYSSYAEEGYLYVGIDPQETVRNDSLVDVVFSVSEGQPSHIHLVQITGNRATREKVIRREIHIHEGDRFRRSLLVSSREELMRLGFFEDVQPDFAAAESTDVDIIFKVKEKTVGTASAGAGYTGQGGLTGFVEIGHTNVLGNGQALNLHLERGGKKSDYSVSFTEPWFRDTPTLLGFSVFTTNQELDIYRQKRQGGSVRIGRPLPWPRFTHGSLTYSLEDVTINQLADTLSLSDSLTLAGIPLGERSRTSSVTFSMLRNTADHPLYPTKGTRTSLTSEFAGGAFGGSINYNKHRFEQRWWFRTFSPHMITMVRARVGALAPYSGQELPVPQYERFRLGGGTTPDPLRGYDDYTVVPDKFDYIVNSGGIPVHVRSPGGRFMELFTVEQQFPIVHPLHGVLFFDAGNTWDRFSEIDPLNLKMGAGAGFRMEIPLLGVIGFDYGYGFDRDDRPKWVGHFLIGQTSF